MHTTMQLKINSFRQLFPDKIISLTIPWLLVKSPTFPRQLSNSQTFPGFPDKWSPCHQTRGFFLIGQFQELTTRPLLLTCTALVPPSRYDASDGLSVITEHYININTKWPCPTRFFIQCQHGVSSGIRQLRWGTVIFNLQLISVLLYSLHIFVFIFICFCTITSFTPLLHVVLHRSASIK